MMYLLLLGLCLACALSLVVGADISSKGPSAYFDTNGTFVHLKVESWPVVAFDQRCLVRGPSRGQFRSWFHGAPSESSA